MENFDNNFEVVKIGPLDKIEDLKTTENLNKLFNEFGKGNIGFGKDGVFVIENYTREEILKKLDWFFDQETIETIEQRLRNGEKEGIFEFIYRDENFYDNVA